MESHSDKNKICDKKIIPVHVQIETVNGACTARCTMCTIGSWTRKPGQMNEETFSKILTKLVPYRQTINYLTLHGCGEPLLDKELPEKVAIAKKMGFRGTGFATNATELDENVAKRLIDSGLDTIIVSIDGLDKATHEAIRIRTDFDKVIANVMRFIDIRNASGKTRVLVRFIRQKINYDQWPEFLKLWTGRLRPEMGDGVLRFDVHNWGSKLEDAGGASDSTNVAKAPMICQDVFERLYIYSNGDVALCCADDNGFFRLGNAIEDDPIAIYNNTIFTNIRYMMKQGKLGELEHCKNCTIPTSRANKE